MSEITRPAQSLWPCKSKVVVVLHFDAVGGNQHQIRNQARKLVDERTMTVHMRP